jgi:hypothetical protein
MNEDFREIAHSGGKITFTVKTDSEGQQAYQVRVSSSRPVPVVMIAVYALPQGVPVGSIQLGGIGTPWNPPPFPGCYPVMIQSDSHGKFGHHCPRCDGYWRGGPWPRVCPYCNVRADGYQFLSKSQLQFVRHYCEVLTSAQDQIDDGEVSIDMDEVADAVSKEVTARPAFYVSEESQQHKFTCRACDEFNDILGRFGYCSHCGTRNDLSEFENRTVVLIRERLNSGAPPHDCVRDAVAAFDTLVGQYAKQLAEQVPLTTRRIERLTKHSFHDLDEVQTVFRNWFDIDICVGIGDGEIARVKLMFFRRHLYEHNGGEVGQKYLEKSGDTTVRLKQVIRETQEGAHALLGSLTKMTRNLHVGFHDLIEVEGEPIRAFEDKKKRHADWQKRGMSAGH